MHRIDTSTAQKDKFGAGKNGFTNGDPQSGTPATEVSDGWLDTLQEEIAAVIEKRGVALNKSDNTQLSEAIFKAATTTDIGMVRKATDAEAKLGEAIDAMMSAKNVADYVKEILKQMFVGMPLPWFAAEPPSWALAMQGQSINPTTDPLLAQRYPALILDDMRRLSIKGLGIADTIRAKQKGTLVSVEMGSGSAIDGVWNVGSVGGVSVQTARNSVGVDDYDVSEYQGIGMGYATLYAAQSLPGVGGGMGTSGIVRVPSRFFNYITMRG